VMLWQVISLYAQPKAPRTGHQFHHIFLSRPCISSTIFFFRDHASVPPITLKSITGHRIYQSVICHAHPCIDPNQSTVHTVAWYGGKSCNAHESSSRVLSTMQRTKCLLFFPKNLNMLFSKTDLWRTGERRISRG
jgi:hypothetical protein